MNLNIPVFDLSYDHDFRDKFQKGCNEIFDQAYLTNHLYVRKFEEKFSEYNSFKYSVAVSNGTSALECALLAIGVIGKQVLLPSNTFVATAVAVINAGGIPRIVDIDSDYDFIDLEKVESILSESRDIGAVIAVHIGGHTSRKIKTLSNILEKYGISLIEDCAHSLGSEVDNIKSGSFSRFSCFSFFMTKVMTTGEGGIVSCSSVEDYNKLQSIRQFGRDSNNPTLHIISGSNFKMTEFQGLLGVLELERIDKRISARRSIAFRYQEKLINSRFYTFADKDGQKGSYYKQVLLSELERTFVESKLQEFGIPLTGGVYYNPLHLQPILAKYIKNESYENSNYFSKHHFCPPCFPELTLSQIDYICDKLLSLERS